MLCSVVYSRSMLTIWHLSRTFLVPGQLNPADLLLHGVDSMLNCSQLRLYFQFKLFYIHSQVKDVKGEAKNRTVSCDIEILKYWFHFLASLAVKAVQALHLSSALSGWTHLPVNLLSPFCRLPPMSLQTSSCSFWACLPFSLDMKKKQAAVFGWQIKYLERKE